MKETYYFQHDYNARNDPKMQDVLIDLGVEGIGVYWCIVEQLYEQGGVLPLCVCKSIAYALHVPFDVVYKLVNNYGLFANDGENMWSTSVLMRLDKRKSISDKRKKSAILRWRKKTGIQEISNMEISENDENTDANASKTYANASKSDANAMQTHQNPMQMHDIKKRKEKESIYNISHTNVCSSTCVDISAQKSTFSVDYSRLLGMWKEYCPGFPQVRSLCEDDRNKIRHRFSEMMTNKDPETAYKRIAEIFKTINASDFCKQGKWCTLRWVFRNATNWRKVEDGNYNNRTSDNKRANEEW